jgi:hypothetical protein
MNDKEKETLSEVVRLLQELLENNPKAREFSSFIANIDQNILHSVPLNTNVFGYSKPETFSELEREALFITESKIDRHCLCGQTGTEEEALNRTLYNALNNEVSREALREGLTYDARAEEFPDLRKVTFNRNRVITYLHNLGFPLFKFDDYFYFENFCLYVLAPDGHYIPIPFSPVTSQRGGIFILLYALVEKLLKISGSWNAGWVEIYATPTDIFRALELAVGDHPTYRGDFREASWLKSTKRNLISNKLARHSIFKFEFQSPQQYLFGIKIPA